MFAIVKLIFIIELKNNAYFETIFLFIFYLNCFHVRSSSAKISFKLGIRFPRILIRGDTGLFSISSKVWKI